MSTSNRDQDSEGHDERNTAPGIDPTAARDAAARKALAELDAQFRTPGLLVGYVQSGKTHTFHALKKELALRKQIKLHGWLTDTKPRKRAWIWRLCFGGTREAPPPGLKLASVARLMLGPKAFKMFVEPVIADMQAEHDDARDAGHKWRARRIHIRAYMLVIPGWLYAIFSARLAKLFRYGANR